MTLQTKSENLNLKQVFCLEDADDGKYYIKSLDVTNKYYAHASGWNFKAHLSDKTPFTINLVDGEESVYTLYQDVSYYQGHAGTDDTVAGSPVYCDKNVSANGKWVFEVLSAEEHVKYVSTLSDMAMALLDQEFVKADSIFKAHSKALSSNEVDAFNKTIEDINNEKGNVTDNIEDEIARLNALAPMVNNAVKKVIYVQSVDNICNDVCYAVVTENRGAWYSEKSQLNSTYKLEHAYDFTAAEQQFAFVKSAKSGNYYLYSVSENKFVFAKDGYTELSDTPVQTISFLEGKRSSDYPWVIAFNTEDGQKQIGVSNNYPLGIITFYNDLTDAGNTVRLEKASKFDATGAIALIQAFESPATVIEDVKIENIKVVYDLNGRRILDTENLVKGIYIIDGKKTFVK